MFEWTCEEMEALRPHLKAVPLACVSLKAKWSTSRPNGGRSVTYPAAPHVFGTADQSVETVPA